MTRLTTPDTATLPEATQQTLGGIASQFGFAPGMFDSLAGNPVVLDLVMGLQRTTAKLLTAKTRHVISLAVSAANGCKYCSALHGFTSAKFSGFTDEDINLARAGSATDPKIAAAAHFAQQVVHTRGHVSDAELAAVRSAGYSDSEIQAIVTVAVVALLTNFLNNVNDTDVDVPAPAAAASN